MIGGMIEQKQLHFFILVKIKSLTVKILFFSILEPSKVVEILYKRNQKEHKLVNGMGVNKTARRNFPTSRFL